MGLTYDPVTGEYTNSPSVLPPGTAAKTGDYLDPNTSEPVPVITIPASPGPPFSAMAFAVEGDAYPRVVICPANNTIYLGDGAGPPTDGTHALAVVGNSEVGGAVGLFAPGTIQLSTPDTIQLTGSDGVVCNGDLHVTTPGGGLVLYSPNNTPYRVKVSDMGVLSTEAV